MKPLLACLLLTLVANSGLGQPQAPATAEALEKELRAAVASERVTLVHLWAPWCSNCRAELSRHGWRDFISVNENVQIIFVTVWSDSDGKAELARYGVGDQANFEHYHHPNTARSSEERMSTLMGQPVTWIPSTWVYKSGKLRYALNYGEVRFPLLQQLVRDAEGSW